MLKQEAQEIAERYAAEKGIGVNLNAHLGSGNDGWVWKSSRPSVIKVLERESKYNTELYCYQRLRDAGVLWIRGFSVPQLVDWSDHLRVIEMTLVIKPYLIDFAKAHFTPLELSDETWEEWNREGIELFGTQRWKTALSVTRELQAYGIYYYDIKPGNLMFEDWTGEDEEDGDNGR
jgi:hypothetical protein